MESDLQTHVAFYLTGNRPAEGLDAIKGLNLKPALFAGFRDLTKLRYDYPLVLLRAPGQPDFVQSLSGVFDALLAQVAQGADGERIRKHVLRLEQELRTRVAQGAAGVLSALWNDAAAAVANGDKSVADSLARARAALKLDGELVDCDAAMPARLLTHAWKAVEAKRRQKFAGDIARSIVKLSDILKVDYDRSDAGRSAENLRGALPTGAADGFDFEAMSSMLKKSLPKPTLPASRKKRIEGLLAVLKTQSFVPVAVGAGEPYAFAFDSCAAALKAYNERLPKVIELARALAVAELEMRGEYSEANHDPIFAAYGKNWLDPSALSRFPGYVVCLKGIPSGTENDKLTEILASGLPMKVLLQTDDLLGDAVSGGANLSFGLRIKQLASMAMGLNSVFVLQSAASNVLRMKGGLQRGLDYPGPALFSIFSGAGLGKAVPGVSAYLTAAAAMESRLFPAFTYDPSAGADWASRFSLAENPQAELDWPVQTFSYEDVEHQKVAEQLPFTIVDFVACDSRYAQHFARVPQAKWNGSLMPVEECVQRETKGMPDQVPSLIMVDGDNQLQRVIVDQSLIRAARVCRDMWHSLQELGGIHNSHAEKLLAREKQAWQQQAAASAAVAPAAAPVAGAASAAAPAAEAAPQAVAEAEAAPERSPDEAYIETARCSTCNECTLLNDKMFAYDGNKQAYIKDINAGTYAQLVEAAESCQVSVIHPGKPKNPKEPGLEELMKRAEPFM